MTAPLDLRADIRARMVVLNQGSFFGAIPALARRLAPRWNVQPASADKALRRYLRDGEDIEANYLADILAELGGRVVWSEPWPLLAVTERPTVPEIDGHPIE